MNNILFDKVKASVQTKEVILSSGKISNFYIDCREVTLEPQYSIIIGKIILEVIQEIGATALGGPVTAACPIVSAVGVLAHQAGVPLKLFYVRKTAKDHGLKKMIEGPQLSPNDKALIVDDVCTSGDSLLHAIINLKNETGCQILGTMVLVDREEGGRDLLKEAGIPFTSIFTKTELV